MAVSDSHFDIKHGVELSLPTQSPLAATLKQSELARGVLDWLIISLCFLAIYVFAKSQLDHEIELSTLPPKKVVKEAPSNAASSKLELFSSQRNHEQEIWADLKDFIQRKQPSNGHCQINTSESKKRTAAGVSRLKSPASKEIQIRYELACWLQVNKKVPYPHQGVENLLDLNILSKFESNDTINSPNDSAAEPTQHKAQDLSPIQNSIQSEGWIETRSGTLHFDAKEQRWK